MRVERTCGRCGAWRYHSYSMNQGSQSRCEVKCAECGHSWKGRLKPDERQDREILQQYLTSRSLQKKGSVKSDWMAGYAAALANFLRRHDQPSMVVDVLIGDGLTISDLKAGGAEPGDLAVLRRAARSGNTSRGLALVDK